MGRHCEGVRARVWLSVMSDALPCVLFFNINGSGLGHLNRCLAYARRLRGRARSVFLSLASAVEFIEDMGFEADYFVSEFWSASHINAWNGELAIRVGMLLEELEPAAVVFDGTWPFHGFMDACDVYKVPIRIWSNRGLHKKDFPPVPVPESAFDLVIQPGEIGAGFEIQRSARPGRKISIPPVTLLDDSELLNRDDARDALGLDRDGRYALLSMGPGNLKDNTGIGPALIDAFRRHEMEVTWARAPISVQDIPLPDDVRPISVFPLARYMRAFDLFAGAAGYNACCEVVQSGVPGLLIPNTLVADDQVRRANIAAGVGSIVVSAFETAKERQGAIEQLLTLQAAPQYDLDLGGAEYAASEIMALIDGTELS